MPNLPRIIPADASRARDIMGFLMDWKITGEQTDGAFSVVETSAPKGSGPPLHYHETADEFFYVVDGTMTFKVGDEIRTIGKSGFVWIPKRVVHSFLIDSDTSRFLFGYVPAGVEQMFIEAIDAAGDRASEPAVSLRLDRDRFRTIIVGPPLVDWLQKDE